MQPANRGTAPPIAFAVVAIAQQDLNATVCILPCDHHYRVETAFCRALDRAFFAAEDHPDYLILQGAQALYPEVEYGWMQLGNRHPGSFPCANSDLYELCAFVEKPPPHRAVELLRRGALWNTFVMVGKVRTFLAILDAALPGLVEALGNVRRNERGERGISMKAYEDLPTWQFSEHVLASSMPNLLVQRLSGAGWTDLGAPARLAAVLAAEGATARPTDQAISPNGAPNHTSLREIAH